MNKMSLFTLFSFIELLKEYFEDTPKDFYIDFYVEIFPEPELVFYYSDLRLAIKIDKDYKLKLFPGSEYDPNGYIPDMDELNPKWNWVLKIFRDTVKKVNESNELTASNLLRLSVTNIRVVKEAFSGYIEDLEPFSYV